MPKASIIDVVDYVCDRGHLREMTLLALTNKLIAGFLPMGTARQIHDICADEEGDEEADCRLATYVEYWRGHPDAKHVLNWLHPKHQTSAFVRASFLCNMSAVTSLTSHPALDVNLIEPGTGNSALIEATSDFDCLEVVAFLVDHPDIDVNLVNAQGFTAAMVACKRGDVDAVRFLTTNDCLDLGIKDFDDKNVLDHANSLEEPEFIRRVRLELVLLITTITTERDALYSTARALVGRAAGKTPLMAASANGHLSVVHLLLGVESIRPNMARTDGTTALLLTSYRGHLPCIRALLAAPGIHSINHARNDGMTCLMMTCLGMFGPRIIAIVRAYLALPGIDVNLRNSANHTALTLACSHGRPRAVGLLLAHPSFKLTDDDVSIVKATFFHAAVKGYAAVVRACLLVPGINASDPNSDGASPLFLASEAARIEVMRVLMPLPGVEMPISTTASAQRALTIARLGDEHARSRLAPWYPDEDDEDEEGKEGEEKEGEGKDGGETSEGAVAAVGEEVGAIRLEGGCESESESKPHSEPDQSQSPTGGEASVPESQAAPALPAALPELSAACRGEGDGEGGGEDEEADQQGSEADDGRR